MTPVRSIPSDFDPSVVAAIERRLRVLEAEHGVSIVWFIESGSRAWGFPSPDSDYDCRFIFIRPLTDYLALSPKRDVIEVPIEEGLDINGWDIFKMARLLLKGNAAAIEWLMSPIVYGGFDEFRRDWCAMADRSVDHVALMKHYLHLGQGQFLKHMAVEGDVSLKKIFYVLRPAIALRWMRLHPDHAVVPMHVPTMMEQVDLGADQKHEIEALLARKAVTREMGKGRFPGPIASLIDSEYRIAEAWLSEAGTREARDPEVVGSMENLVRQWIMRCGEPTRASAST